MNPIVEWAMYLSIGTCCLVWLYEEIMKTDFFYKKEEEEENKED